jgi:hypothetical protein
MHGRRGDGDQILGPGELLGLMTYLVRVKFPAEAFPAGDDNIDAKIAYFRRALRERTQKYWPGLWANEEQAYRVLERMQGLLRRFWEEQDEHDRDWYISRARLAVQRFRVQHELGGEFQLKLETVNDVLRLNARIEELLDNPPARVLPFEEALYQLQRRALVPSKRPLRCLNTDCKHYFLSEKKGTKFCSPECARPNLLASKRNYDHKKRRTR